jgi:hypothetical protein
MKLFAELGILSSLEVHRRNVINAQKDIFCPIQIGRDLGATIFTPQVSPDDTIACKHCHRFFLRTDPRLRKKFSCHPCLTTKETAPNVETDLITMKSPEWLAHLQECKSMLQDDDQKACYKHFFPDKPGKPGKQIASLLIAGAAGQGKTTVVEVLIKCIATTEGFNRTIITSFTHAATDLLGGETLHKVAHLGIMGPDILSYLHGDNDESLLSRVQRFIQDRFLRNADPAVSLLQIRQAKYFFLDEFGDMFVALAKFLDLLFQIIRGIQEPYGGLINVWSGDYFQTNIIVDKVFKKMFTDAYNNEMKLGIPNAKSKFRSSEFDPFYTSPAFLDLGFDCLLFNPKTPNHRFKDNPMWGEFLALVRVGQMTDKYHNWYNRERAKTCVPLACRQLLQYANFSAIARNYIDFIKSFEKVKPIGVTFEQFRNLVFGGRYKWDELVMNDDYNKSKGGILCPYRVEMTFTAGKVVASNSNFISSLQGIPRNVLYTPTYVVSQHIQMKELDNALHRISFNKSPHFTHKCSFELKIRSGQAQFGSSEQQLESMYEKCPHKKEVDSKFTKVFQCSTGDVFQLTSSFAGFYLGTSDLVTIKSIDTSDTSNPKLIVRVHQQGKHQQAVDRIIEPVRFEMRIDDNRMMQITQFPLTRACSTTTLKTRGRTLDQVAASIALKLSPSEFYIMASRVRHIHHFWSSLPLPPLNSSELSQIIRPNRFAGGFHQYLLGKLTRLGSSENRVFKIDDYIRCTG